MRTITLNAPGKLEIANDIQPPPPGKDEAQVRVRRIGICGTDLHAYHGDQPFFTYPRILGHELAVEVVAVGADSIESELKVGDRCCLRPYINCGACAACHRGLENCCINLQVMGVHRDGGMREVINVPIDKLHPSTVLADETLALVEMLGIGCHAVRRSGVLPTETVLVVGMGPIGLGVAQFAHLMGANVIAMEINDTRLAFARRHGGIDHTIDAKHDIFEQLKAIIPDDLPTVVFDATGNAASMMKSFEYVAHGGKLVFVGLFEGNVRFYDPEFHKREQTLLASRNALKQDFDYVIGALESNQIEVESWITNRVSPEEMIRDFPEWLNPANGTFKAMLDL